MKRVMMHKATDRSKQSQPDGDRCFACFACKDALAYSQKMFQKKPYAKLVDQAAHRLFPCVNRQSQRRSLRQCTNT